jgi:hypothetical protein
MPYCDLHAAQVRIELTYLYLLHVAIGQKIFINTVTYLVNSCDIQNEVKNKHLSDTMHFEFWRQISARRL